MAVIKLAINGYGRIGRNILRALYESGRTNEFKIVAVNDLGADLKVNVNLTKRDSVHGQFPFAVEQVEGGISVNGDKIQFLAERDPKNLPWRELGIDVVLECTGVFSTKAKANGHLEAGAKKVLISAPGGSDVDATIVYGVNHKVLTKDMTVVSNASCTTNCLAPVVQVLNNLAGIEQGLMTTIHSYTNDQVLTDVYHDDIRRARAAAMSMIPTKTGAAAAIGLVIPELNGKLDGLSVRVPTPNVSVVDFTFNTKRQISVDEINKAVKDASEGYLKNILAYNEEPLVSIDVNHNSASSLFDATQTRVAGKMAKIFSWYDNEWGFSNRMLDTAKAMVEAQ